MRLEHTPDDEAFRAQLVAFLDEHAPPEAGDWNAGSPELLPGWALRWQAMLFDHGWMVPGNPRHLGGRGATLTQTVIYLEELAARDLPRSMHFAGYAIVAPTLLQFGTPEQQALAPGALRGDTVWCVGMSEPDAGSDLAALRTRAEVRPDGFVVAGQKIWTSYAPIADRCLCYVRTGAEQPKHEGISALIIDMRSAGVEVRPLAHLGGTAEFAEVFFDEVEVPRDHLVGELGKGWAILNGALSHERSLMWLEAVVRCEHVLGDVVELCRTVRMDRDPIVRNRIAEVHGRVASLRALGFAGLTGGGVQALLMKVATSELYSDLLELGCDLAGPAGVAIDADHVGIGRPWAAHLLLGLAGTIAGGTSEIQRDIVARHGLGLPMR